MRTIMIQSAISRWLINKNKKLRNGDRTNNVERNKKNNNKKKGRKECKSSKKEDKRNNKKMNKEEKLLNREDRNFKNKDNNTLIEILTMKKQKSAKV